MAKILILFLLTFSSFLSAETSQALKDDNAKIKAFSEEIAKFYQLDEGQNYKDITDMILASPNTASDVKDSIHQYHRRIYIFRYPSDALSIIGYISVTPNESGQPLEVLFRGGNKLFGLNNPGNFLSTYKDITVISSTLRDGVSEGKDEFGGADVIDVKNLVAFIPTLEEELHINLHPSHIFALGSSRGGMEMFLSLERFPELQNFFDKVVSLSSALDMNDIIQKRSDMKKMFIDEYGLMPGLNDEQWISKRNPFAHISSIKPTLPFLIIQGTEDIRVSLKEGHEMTQCLKDNGNPVTYWEIKGGKHTLYNIPDIMERIVNWVNSSDI